MSIDVTHANAKFSDDSKEQGQSYRFRYNKNINDIGTNIALAGYRYSIKGYYSLSEVFDTFRDTHYTPEIERRRNRGEITLSQNLGENYGSLSIGYVNEDYWNSDKKTQSATLGYSNSWQGISYGINYTYNRDTSTYAYQGKSQGQSENDHQLALNVSIPINLFDSTFYYNLNTNSNSGGPNSGNMGLSASQLDNRLNWSIQQGYTSQGQGASGKLALSGADKATGVAIQLLDKNSVPIKLNTKNSLQNSVPAGDYMFNWKARYIKTADKITPGSANSTATVNIRYE